MAKGILVVGELNVDVIVSGLSGLPALGREIVSSRFCRVLGSSSAICAAGLARLGAPVAFLGKIGADGDGEFLINQLRTLPVATDYVIRSRRANTGVTISLAYPEDRALITYPGCVSELKMEDIDLSILSCYQHLHVGSYFLQKELQPGLRSLFAEARHRGLTVSLDPGSDPEEQWGGADLLGVLDQADIFLPNESEARAIAGIDGTEAGLRQLAKHGGEVIVKCGAAGAKTLDNGRILHSPGFRVKTIDPTGAGDSFDAGFIYARVVQGLPLGQALGFANACGALATTGLGGTAAQPTERQVERFLQEHTALQNPNSSMLRDYSTRVC
jgi:sugar/nucleoside kinase (ribokinase family)